MYANIPVNDFIYSTKIRYTWLSGSVLTRGGRSYVTRLKIACNVDSIVRRDKNETSHETLTNNRIFPGHRLEVIKSTTHFLLCVNVSFVRDSVNSCTSQSDKDASLLSNASQYASTREQPSSIMRRFNSVRRRKFRRYASAGASYINTSGT